MPDTLVSCHEGIHINSKEAIDANPYPVSAPLITFLVLYNRPRLVAVLTERDQP